MLKALKAPYNCYVVLRKAWLPLTSQHHNSLHTSSNYLANNAQACKCVRSEVPVIKLGFSHVIWKCYEVKLGGGNHEWLSLKEGHIYWRVCFHPALNCPDERGHISLRRGQEWGAFVLFPKSTDGMSFDGKKQKAFNHNII